MNATAPIAGPVRYEDVVRTAVGLLAQGHNPSGDRVREFLGRGSKTTISQHLRTWRARLDAATLEVLPPALPPELLGPLQQLWTVAVTTAARDYARARQAHEEARAELQAELARERSARAGEGANRLAREALLAEALAGSEALNARLAQCAAEVRGLRAQAAASAEHQAAEHAPLQQRIAELEARIALEEERSDGQQLHWIRQIDLARQEARDTLERQQAEIKRLLEERQILQARNARLTDLNEALTRRLAGLSGAAAPP